MQFVLLIYQGTTPLPGTDRWNALPEEEQKRVYEEYGDLNKAPGVTPGLPLGLPKDAKTVRAKNGSAQVSDGPYVDARGAVGGYFILEADDLDPSREGSKEKHFFRTLQYPGGPCPLVPIGGNSRHERTPNLVRDVPRTRDRNRGPAGWRGIRSGPAGSALSAIPWICLLDCLSALLLSQQHLS